MNAASWEQLERSETMKKHMKGDTRDGERVFWSETEYEAFAREERERLLLEKIAAGFCVVVFAATVAATIAAAVARGMAGL